MQAPLRASGHASWVDVFHGDHMAALLRHLDLEDMLSLMTIDPYIAWQVRSRYQQLLGDPFDDGARLTSFWLAVLQSQPRRLRQLLSLPVPLPSGLVSGRLTLLNLARQLADGGACAELLSNAFQSAAESEAQAEPESGGRVERLPSNCGPAAVVDGGLAGQYVVVLDAGRVQVHHGCGTERTSLAQAVPSEPGMVTRVSCGASHVAMVADGLLWVAGRGPGALPGFGQEGNVQDSPQLWSVALAARVPGPVVQVATLRKATYALNAAGEIWAWGFHYDWLPGLSYDLKHTVQTSPARVNEIVEDQECEDCPMFQDIAASWDGHEGLLAALSVDGTLYACGNYIKRYDSDEDEDEDEYTGYDGWHGTPTPIPTPEPVVSILVTRAMPEEVGYGFLPDRRAPDRTYGEIAAGGLLALLADGTVFAALQQQRVPGLACVEAMAECGPRSTAFQVRRGDQSVTVVRHFS